MADNTFMHGLVGGLLIIALLLLVFNTAWAFSDGTQPRQGLVVLINGQQVLIPAGDGQRVVNYIPGDERAGIIYEDTSFHSILGTFSISSETQTLVFPGGRTENGLVFGEKSMQFVAENPSQIRIFIEKQNNFGDFVMLVNGVVQVKERLASGMHTFDLNSQGEAHIELRAESSEWKFWAPSFYDIGRVEIDAVSNIDSFEFRAVDADKFSRGSVEFDFTENSGTIEVFVNSQSAYRGAAGQRLVIPLAGIYARNTIVLRAVDGSFAGTASVSEVDTDRIIKKMEVKYGIDNEPLEPAWAAFELVLLRPGTLVVKNINENGEFLVDVREARNGLKLLRIGSENLAQGENTLVIEGAGDALFIVRDLHIVA